MNNNQDTIKELLRQRSVLIFKAGVFDNEVMQQEIIRIDNLIEKLSGITPEKK